MRRVNRIHWNKARSKNHSCWNLCCRRLSH